MAQDSSNNPLDLDEFSESAAFLKELPEQASSVSRTVREIIEKIESGSSPMQKGISFLDVKCHMLLEYLINLVLIIQKKIKGKQIENDLAIERLVELRIVLEKMRPIDQRLNYQIQKLLTAANTGTVSADDPLRFRPNPDNLVNQYNDGGEAKKGSDESDSDEAEKKTQKSDVYVPPKISAAYYEGDETAQMRQQKTLEHVKKRALSSSVLQELRKEYDTGPEEIKEMTNMHRQKVSDEIKERTRYEEEYMMRLPHTKKQKHELRNVTTISSLNSLTKFDDISALDDTQGDVPSQKKRRSKKFTPKGRKRKSFRRKRH